jgi:hypothetical protein
VDLASTQRVSEENQRRRNDVQSANRLGWVHEKHAATGLQHAVHLANRAWQIGNMLDAMKRVEMIEGLVLERERLRVHHEEAIGDAVGDGLRIEIDADRLWRQVLSHALREEATTTADLEHTVIPSGA